MKFKYVVLIFLALGIGLIHLDSVAFPHSVIVRHVILIAFIVIAGYFAYESRRRHLEAYEKLRRFLRICSWCRKVCFTDPDTKEEKWVTFEEYMALEHKSTSSHGICPDCYRRMDIYSDSN
ncbi:MAG TPA: hypothetical protein VIH45_03720 [Desulfuromonadaceae bacterium]